MSSSGSATYRVAIQGGGMRVAYALGAIETLRKSGVEVRSVSCSSAGAVAALGLLADDIEAYTDVLVDRLASRRFINPWRFYKIADMDYLVNEVVFTMLDPAVLSQADTEIWVSLVDANDAMLRHRRLDAINARTLLLATQAIPILYGRPVEFDGAHYFDGGIGDTLPLLHAAHLAEPGDVLLPIATRPVLRLTSHRNGLGERIGVTLDPRVARSVRHLILAPNPLVSTTIEVLDRGSIAGCDIVCCEPSDPNRNFSRTNTNREQLEGLRELGRSDMIAALAAAPDTRLSSGSSGNA